MLLCPANVHYHHNVNCFKFIFNPNRINKAHDKTISNRTQQKTVPSELKFLKWFTVTMRPTSKGVI